MIRKQSLSPNTCKYLYYLFPKFVDHTELSRSPTPRKKGIIYLLVRIQNTNNLSAMTSTCHLSDFKGCDKEEFAFPTKTCCLTTGLSQNSTAHNTIKPQHILQQTNLTIDYCFYLSINHIFLYKTNLLV